MTEMEQQNQARKPLKWHGQPVHGPGQENHFRGGHRGELRLILYIFQYNNVELSILKSQF
jgi:hypothetical protein